MAEKSFNTGRVVGWSAYEEFIMETGADPSRITNQVYQTLVTYGVTRKVLLSPGIASQPDEEGWTPTHGGQFYTQTVRVPGASWGAVPIIGVDYATFLEVFIRPSSTTTATELVDSEEKQALDEAVGNIFTVYISDEFGNKATQPTSAHGYLTFVAFPDVLKFNDRIPDLPGAKMSLIVRGLSMEDLDVNGLYYGPQGLMFAGNGMAEDGYHKTIDINNLCLNASGNIWLNTSGYSAGSTVTDHRWLSNRALIGDTLVSSFGYVNQNFLNGTGIYQNLGRYGLTYEEYQHALAGKNHNHDNVDILTNKNDYLYLIAGIASFDEDPPISHPMEIIPVRKSDGYLNVGQYDGFEVQGKKPFDWCLTHVTNDADDSTVIHVKNKITGNYFGSFWPATRVSPTDKLPCSISYGGSGSFGSHMVITDEITDSTGVEPAMPDRNACYHAEDERFLKGYYWILGNQTTSHTNGIYMCTKDDGHEGLGYSLLNRRGSYLQIATDFPEYCHSKGYADITAVFPNAAVFNGVLVIDNTYIFPGEILCIITTDTTAAKRERLFYVWGTVDSGNPRLIVSSAGNTGIPTLTLDSSAVIDDTSSNQYSDILILTRADWDAMFTRTVDVYTDDSTYTSVSITGGDVTRGARFIIQIDASAGTYGAGNSYTYAVLNINAAYVTIAAEMCWLDNPLLTEVVGYPGLYNGIVPCYKEQLPNASGSYYYNMKRTMSNLTAAEMFADYGLDIADYVHEDYQNLNLEEFLQECAIRKNLYQARTGDTLRDVGVDSTYYFYSITDLNWDGGNDPFPTPTPSSPIRASMKIHAETNATNFFDTAYYTAQSRTGDTWSDISIRNADYPIWATAGKSKFGEETLSISVIDDKRNRLDFSGNSGSIDVDAVDWFHLLTALGTGQKLDLLKGVRFRKGENNTQIITSEGVVLVLATEEPTGNIDDGAIGIGWLSEGGTNPIWLKSNGSWISII